jgi:hypothetical protein
MTETNYMLITHNFWNNNTKLINLSEHAVIIKTLRNSNSPCIVEIRYTRAYKVNKGKFSRKISVESLMLLYVNMKKNG